MVTRQEEIDTDSSPVVSDAVFQTSVEIRYANFSDRSLNMHAIRILFFHVLLFGIVFSSPVENKDKEKKLMPEVTTHPPLKGAVPKNLNIEQVQSLTNAQVGKSSTKKRNVPRVFTDKNEYLDDDFYEGRATDDYDTNQAFKTLMDNTRKDNSLFDLGKYRVNDYRYYEDESRRKRTIPLEDMMSKAEGNQEPEIRLSPEDLMVLAAYRQQHRLYNSYPYGRWGDINNAIDLPEEETETEEVFDRPENFFDKYYDQRYQNWANLPKSNKFMNHQGRGYAGYPKLRMPVY